MFYLFPCAGAGGGTPLQKNNDMCNGQISRKMMYSQRREQLNINHLGMVTWKPSKITIRKFYILQNEKLISSFNSYAIMGNRTPYSLVVVVSFGGFVILL